MTCIISNELPQQVKSNIENDLPTVLSRATPTEAFKFFPISFHEISSVNVLPVSVLTKICMVTAEKRGSC